jgi:hypothetical protein
MVFISPVKTSFYSLNRGGKMLFLSKEENEIIIRLLNKFNPYVLPVEGQHYPKPTHDQILRVVNRFEGSYELAELVSKIYSNYNRLIDFEKCVYIANSIWRIAYPNYPYKVEWHEDCQGYFEIWNEVGTNKFFVECEECSAQEDHPANIKNGNGSKESYQIRVYPTIKELKDIGWYKYIIR